MTAAAIAVWVIPLLCSLALGKRNRATRARQIALGAAIASLLLSLFLMAFSPPQVTARAPQSVDRMTSVLLVSASGLLVAVLVATPRAQLDAILLADILFFEAATLAVIVSNHLVLFLIAWLASFLPLIREARRTRQPGVRRAALFLTALSALPMLVALCIVWAGTRTTDPHSTLRFASLATSPFVRRWEGVLAPLVAVAVASRAGIFPLHLWVPEVVENVRLPLAVPLSISPLASFAAVEVLLTLFPHFVKDHGAIFVMWGAASCGYGAVLSLARDNVRRQLAFVWVSAVGSMLVGIGTSNAIALSGALFYDVVAAVALTGLLLIAGAVEARLGTSDMRKMGGVVRYTPIIATAYLLLGLAVVSFPGTAGFVSEHLLIQGLHEVNPTIAIVLLGANALNGIALVRSYKRIFLGPPNGFRERLWTVEDALPRERLVLGALVLALLLGWFFPTPLLRVRESVTATMGK